jgi:protease PrsW
MEILLLALAIFPGLFISWYIWWRDKHEREPHKYLIACFLFGILSVVPAILLGEIGVSMGYVKGPDVFTTFIFAMVVVGFSEEFSKYIFLRYYIFPKKEFCEPMDGIVYAVMISMGFATFENVLYVFGQESFDKALTVGILRMITAVPAHASFAIIMGYYVGKAKFNEEKKNTYLLKGLLWATAAHGLYDFFLFQEMHATLVFYAFFVLIAALIFSSKMINHHIATSPYNDKKPKSF